MGEPVELISRSETVLAERVAGTTVVLDPATDCCARLNRSGGLLWDALAEPATVDALVVKLVDACGIEPDRARADVLAFVADLRSRGLVEIA